MVTPSSLQFSAGDWCGRTVKHRAFRHSLKRFTKNYVPSQSSTWNLKTAPWNRRFLLETIIFRFHVHLPWGIGLYTHTTSESRGLTSKGMMGEDQTMPSSSRSWHIKKKPIIVARFRENKFIKFQVLHTFLNDQGTYGFLRKWSQVGLRLQTRHHMRTLESMPVAAGSCSGATAIQC